MGRVSDAAALKADVLVVAKFLESAETIYIIVCFTVFAGVAAVQAACDVDVLEILRQLSMLVMTLGPLGLFHQLSASPGQLISSDDFICKLNSLKLSEVLLDCHHVSNHLCRM